MLGCVLLLAVMRKMCRGRRSGVTGEHVASSRW
jgi:hypothetical protein